MQRRSLLDRVRLAHPAAVAVGFALLAAAIVGAILLIDSLAGSEAEDPLAGLVADARSQPVPPQTEVPVEASVVPASGGRAEPAPDELSLVPGERAAVLEVSPDDLAESPPGAATMRLYTSGPEANLLLREARERRGRIEPGAPVAPVSTVAGGFTEVDVTQALAEGTRAYTLEAVRAQDDGEQPAVTVALAGEHSPELALTDAVAAKAWALPGEALPPPLRSAAGGGDPGGPEVTLDSPARPAEVEVTPLFSGRLASGDGAIPTVRLGIWAGDELAGSPLAAPRGLVEGDRWSLLRPLPPGEWTVVAIQADRSGRVGTSDPVTITVDAAPRLAAAGDIACAPDNPYFNDLRGSPREQQCEMLAVSDEIIRSKPSAVLALGDIQYEGGEPENYRASWDPTWGRLEPAMWPVIGNHEVFPIPGIEPGEWYWDHFNGKGEETGIAGERGKGWYSVDAGWWHIAALNSNCDTSPELCDPDGEQAEWLREDLMRSQARCTIVALHHPIVTIGETPDLSELRPIWEILEEAGVDIALVSHAHNYERWAPIGADGERDDETGLRQFVVGTGGVGLGDTPENDGRVQVASEIDDGERWEGFLDLELGQGSYAWRFINAAGGINDRGAGVCN